ncbi:DUF881 domain-containing protein [Modestobacter sp. NPDC049651]|uniref:DUF881 domain-containing protein n=1 Tax=unclassified Modestobacter TaxID=2643866 RepID=UPI0033EB0D34
MPRSRPSLRGRFSRPSLWVALVPVVALVAGLLFATSGRTAQGTDLRAGDNSQLSEVIEQRNRSVTRQQQELARLQAEAQRLTKQAASRNGGVADAQAQGEAEQAAAGLTEVTGAGLQVRLDDAPASPGSGLPAGAQPDDLVIHQSDVQAVVNAMWAAGAQGVAIMGKRLVATSAVRCVGNTLLLQGRTYSPPFVVTAVGDASAMRQHLGQSQDLTWLQQAVDRYGLTYQVQEQRHVTLPPYDGALDMRWAQVG